MKKLLTTILTLAVMINMTMVVMAEDTTDVTAKFNSYEKTDVQSVDITWGSMQFDYNESSQTWDDETHEWASNEDGTWTTASGSSNIITLENHSSTAVDAAFNFTAESAYSNVDGSFSSTSITMEIPSANTDAKTYDVTFTPSGTFSDSNETYVKVGIITVTLS